MTIPDSFYLSSLVTKSVWVKVSWLNCWKWFGWSDAVVIRTDAEMDRRGPSSRPVSVLCTTLHSSCLEPEIDVCSTDHPGASWPLGPSLLPDQETEGNEPGTFGIHVLYWTSAPGNPVNPWHWSCQPGSWDWRQEPYIADFWGDSLKEWSRPWDNTR